MRGITLEAAETDLREAGVVPVYEGYGDSRRAPGTSRRVVQLSSDIGTPRAPGEVQHSLATDAAGEQGFGRFRRTIPGVAPADLRIESPLGHQAGQEGKVASILMDSATYEAYEPYGTNTDQNGHPLTPGGPKPLPHLTPDERAVYNRLVDPALQTHRRIEQERIPLQVAVDAVTGCITNHST